MNIPTILCKAGLFFLLLLTGPVILQMKSTLCASSNMQCTVQKGDVGDDSLTSVRLLLRIVLHPRHPISLFMYSSYNLYAAASVFRGGFFFPSNPLPILMEFYFKL